MFYAYCFFSFIASDPVTVNNWSSLLLLLLLLPVKYRAHSGALSYLCYVQAEIKMKRLESPPSGRFMLVARVPVAPPTIRHIVSKSKAML